MKTLVRQLACVVLACAGGVVAAAPMSRSDVPASLRDWLPWAMHGQAQALCPAPYNSNDGKACVWPARLVLKAAAEGATFSLEVQVFSGPSMVTLPGEAALWPQSVKADGQAVPVVAQGDAPQVQLQPGKHVLEGVIPWRAMPQDLPVPREVASLLLWVDGVPVSRAPDAEGRVWLKQPPQEAQSSDSVTVHTTRLVDDQVPMTVTTHFDIAMAGKAREIELPAALLPGFVAKGLQSDLPVRLKDDGKLVVQARPGNWTIELSGRLMSPVMAVSLPKASTQAEEVWSFSAHNDVRLVSVEGVSSVDPKQVAMPEAWRAYPAYRLKPGDTLKLVQTRRGNPVPNPDSLRIARKLWLDFDGGGYTIHDDITGTLSRSSRLEMAAPAALGRASVDESDQPITRMKPQGPDGLEVREGTAKVSADSRINSDDRTLPATGWAVDFNQASAVLNLPPGWRLLHATGVDQAEGSWLSQWTLWDFFFVLLSALAAGRLFGVQGGALLGAALVLTWHMPGAPHSLWLVFLGLHGLDKVLPVGKLRALSNWAQWLSAALIVLALLPYAVDQIRLSMYPALERPWQSMGEANEAPLPTPVPAAAEMPRESAQSEASEYSSMDGRYSVSKSAPAPAPAKVAAPRLEEVDPGAKVQTGPGLPGWQWNAHRLSWQGPVQQGQSLRLMLLPPAGTVALRLGGLLLLVLAWWRLARALPTRPSWPLPDGEPPAKAPASAVVSALALIVLGGSLILSAPGVAQAKVAATAPAAAPAPALVPLPPAPPEPPVAPGLLDELRARLTAPPDCLPSCAEVSRLLVEAAGGRIQLRLEVHAQADVSVPLPGQAANWRPASILVNGQGAATRRDESGALWVALSKGVNLVVMEADVGNASSVDISLPMPVREVKSQLQGWSLAGLDARGLASGALSLSREQTAATEQDQGTQRDALPPFVQIERVVHLGLRWTVETHVTRAAPSLAPVRVRVRLMAGESVNDDGVQVQDGVATVQLGAEESRTFVSTLKEVPQLQLNSSAEPHQIELWRLDTSTQWHVSLAGIAPVVHQSGGRWMPTWQPWPGEQVQVQISKPGGVAGQTLTVDRVTTLQTPGVRATDVTAQVSLRSSQGGNHRFELPPQAELLAVSYDGQVLPVQQQGSAVIVPITPGAHVVKIDWREPRGMAWWFGTQGLKVGAAGVNDVLTLNVPADRVVLAVGGPSVGPAVLFWGVLIVIIVAALALGRLKLTPLRAASWALLGLGVAQMSLVGMVTVVGFFLVLEARKRMPLPKRPGMFALIQLLLALWGVLAAGVLLETVRVGLLGFPDLMVLGNGSDAAHLHWFADRFSQTTAAAWVASAPVYAYRVAMLLWALWLAASLLDWIKWAWECFSTGGYWPSSLRGQRPPPAPKAGSDAWVDDTPANS
jgi:hypothetical protein